MFFFFFKFYFFKNKNYTNLLCKKNFFFSSLGKKWKTFSNVFLEYDTHFKFRDNIDYNVCLGYNYRNFNFIFLFYKKVVFMSFYYNFHINYLYALNFLVSKIRNNLFLFFFNTKNMNLTVLYFSVLKKNKKYIYFVDKLILNQIVAICIRLQVVFNYFFFYNLNSYLYFINLSIYKNKINYYYNYYLFFGQI